MYIGLMPPGYCRRKIITLAAELGEQASFNHVTFVVPCCSLVSLDIAINCWGSFLQIHIVIVGSPD